MASRDCESVGAMTLLPDLLQLLGCYLLGAGHAGGAERGLLHHTGLHDLLRDGLLHMAAAARLNTGVALRAHLLGAL